MTRMRLEPRLLPAWASAKAVRGDSREQTGAYAKHGVVVLIRLAVGE